MALSVFRVMQSVSGVKSKRTGLRLCPPSHQDCPITSTQTMRWTRSSSFPLSLTLVRSSPIATATTEASEHAGLSLYFDGRDRRARDLTQAVGGEGPRALVVRGVLGLPGTPRPDEWDRSVGVGTKGVNVWSICQSQLSGLANGGW